MPVEECDNKLGEPHNILSPPPSVLLLNGFPRVGKFTIAKALEAELITNGTPHRLFDNHTIIDTAEAILAGRKAAHYALKKQFRKVAFKALQELDDEKHVIIMTACLGITPDDLDLFSEYADIADGRGIPLVMVNVVCDVETNSRRLANEERKEGVKTKLVDISVLETIRREMKLLDRRHAMKYGKEGSVLHFELDTSELGVDEATQKIWELLGETLVQG